MPRQPEQSCGSSGLEMARPGLEPGTPRSSVVIKRPAGAKSLETVRFQQDRCGAQMFGICGLFSAILGLTDTSGPIRPHVPIRYKGSPRRASPRRRRTRRDRRGIAFGARSSGEMPAGSAWRACVPSVTCAVTFVFAWVCDAAPRLHSAGAREPASWVGSARSVAEAGKHSARIHAPAHRPKR